MWPIGAVIIAAGMAVLTAVLLGTLVDAHSRARAWIALYLLAMMGEMWVAPVVYLSSPSVASLVTGITVSGVLMVASIVPLLVGLFRGSGSPEGATVVGPDPVRLGLGSAGLAALLVIANEFLMAWGLRLAQGAVTIGGGALPLIVGTVNSPWFVFTMAGEMVLTVALLRRRLTNELLAVLLIQAAIMVFTPTALGGPAWSSLSIDASSALMIGLFVFLFEHIYRHRQLSEPFEAYLIELVSVYGLMMGGLFVWQYYGDATVFAASLLLEMIIVYVAVTRPAGFRDGRSTPWQLRPGWTFLLLSGVFVAEIFMGAVLSVELEPSTYLGGFPFLPLSGNAATIAGNAVSNGFWFFATSAASTWFLAMMGLEMGALVVFKFRESKNLENRVRLLLMMGCYGGFAVFYPSTYFAQLAPNAPDPSTVPVLGWSMGIGSYPLALGTFSAVLLTYLITGVLVALFGRRVICSVFCTAPLMYQGSAIDSMKSFNRSSPLARKYLSSRLSKAYSVTLSVVMIALVGTSLLSYLDSIGRLGVSVQGTDPSVFLFAASFSVAWYVLFVTIPYTGNYNCVTMGWCYTGVIAGAFQKLGTFKLKVRDPQVCKDCTTVDCAKGCPVGLTDMVGHFRQSGEFRSTKCCGVGDCVEDCPYDNLYISDIRHSIRRVLGRPVTRPRRASAPTPISRSIGRGAISAAPASPPMVGGPLPMFVPSAVAEP